MSIKGLGLTGLILLAVSTSMPVAVFAQDQEPVPISLGDLARQLRAQRSKNGPNSSGVITNDDFRSRPIEPGSASQQDAAKPGDAKSAEKDKHALSAEEQAGSGHRPQYFRTKMYGLRRTLEQDQEALRKVDERIADKGLRLDDYGGIDPYLIRKAYNPTDTEVDWAPVITIFPIHYSLKQRIANDQKAISDLEDQCRREGCEPAWLR